MAPSTSSNVMSSLFGSAASKKRRVGATATQRAEKEMERYLAEDPIALDADPLSWWHDRIAALPHLAELVRKVWCFPASSVRSEEAFSVAGDILRPKRSRLLPENVDKLVFLSENIPIVENFAPFDSESESDAEKDSEKDSESGSDSESEM